MSQNILSSELYKDWNYGVVKITPSPKNKELFNMSITSKGKKIIVKYIDYDDTTIKCIDSRGFVFYTSVKSLA